MKKLFFIPFLFYAGNNGICQQIDTLYYDNNGRGVDHISFASCYRILSFPTNPNFPKRFRDYSINGTLQGEGFFSYVDKYDDAKSKLIDKCIFYYHNGNTSQILNFNKDGLLDGIQEVYYDNGRIYTAITYKNGIVDGVVQSFDEEGNLVWSKTYSEGIENGDQILYQDGVPYQIIPYKNGKINGTFRELTQSGVPTRIMTYEDNLRVGIYEDREKGAAYQGIYKKMGDQPVNISAAVVKRRYNLEVDKTNRRLLWHVGAKFGKIQLICFDINCYNNSEQDVTCKIENIKVEFLKKNKLSEGILISENDAMKIIQASTTLVVNSTYASARNTANEAATQKSNNHSSGMSTNNTNIDVQNNSKYNSKTGAVAATADAAIGGDNAGYVVGGIGAALATFGAKTDSETNSKLSGTIRQIGTSFNSSHSTQIDGYLRYQIYEKEKVAAEAQEQAAYEYATQMASRIRYSQFTIKSNTSADKQIIVKNEEEFDHIRLSFTMNGILCVAEWNQDEIDKRD